MPPKAYTLNLSPMSLFKRDAHYRLYVALYDNSDNTHHRHHHQKGIITTNDAPANDYDPEKLEWALVVMPKSRLTPDATAQSGTPGASDRDAHERRKKLASRPRYTSSLCLPAAGFSRQSQSNDDKSSCRVLRIQSTAHHTQEILLSKSSSSETHFADSTDSFVGLQHCWSLDQRRVDSPEKDLELVGLFHVADLRSSQDVARFVFFLRALPTFPPPNTAEEMDDSEYVFVDGDPLFGRSEKVYMQELVTASPERHEDLAESWSSASWVLMALERLRGEEGMAHPEMPTRQKLELAVSRLGPGLWRRYQSEAPFEFDACAIDVRMTANVSLSSLISVALRITVGGTDTSLRSGFPAPDAKTVPYSSISSKSEELLYINRMGH
ncbi:hypothetical protein DL93DRAFT_1586064 [Clavulina sp. PMI_390]|nr:hypothetical protein DL93DRAFT_1586064 [Clavulina sp. PMI_390]